MLKKDYLRGKKNSYKYRSGGKTDVAYLWICSMTSEISMTVGDWLLYNNAARAVNGENRNSKAKREASSMSLQDAELVARTQDGDQTAFEALVRRYQGKAYAIAYNMCSGDSEEARELTQEAFLRAFRSLKNFRGKSSFYTWFYRILINTCLDSRRRRSRWEGIFSFWRRDKHEKTFSDEINAEYPDPKEHSNPMDALDNKQLAQEIRQALASLPEKQRVVFQLKVLHGMRIREIAKIVGSAEGTVKSHLFRATQFMREALQEWAQP
jgi:RNA polymerase sigma-70 factor (ECF subfamily)